MTRGHLPVLPPPCPRDESKCSFHGILDDSLEMEGQSPSAGISSTARSGAPSSSASSPRPRPSSHICTPNKVAVALTSGESGRRRRERKQASVRWADETGLRTGNSSHGQPLRSPSLPARPPSSPSFDASHVSCCLACFPRSHPAGKLCSFQLHWNLSRLIFPNPSS